MVALIDYGMGNIHSVKKALEACGAKVSVTNSPKEISAAEKIVLPGVGAFCDAMRQLEKRGVVLVIKDHIADNKPFLGICLGMQLLFQESQESEGCRGLGVLKGGVRRLPEGDFKVPHMGWNQVRPGKKGSCILLQGISEEEYFYFCHSYYPVPDDKEDIAATTEHGMNFASIVCKNNVFGAQFHPEKSQSAGLKIMDNFLRLC